MPADLSVPAPFHFFHLTGADFAAAAQSVGLARFRTDQVLDWVYRKLVTEPAAMTNLSVADRRRLGESFAFITSTILRRQDSGDGTIKLLLGWPDGAQAETVLIPDGPRRTACVSSQVGCPAGCRFCASGVGGFKKNLTAGQIVEQVVQLNLILRPAGERINHVVFMGMGEPLANYDNVLRAVRILHDPATLGLSARKITISTVGVPQRIVQLAQEALPVNLAISLHAPEQTLREKLIPWAEHFSLEDILEAARAYFQKTGREVTLEYILLAGVNDQPPQAKRLAKLCHSLRANVNLIQYNEVAGLGFGRPASADVVRFQKILREAGVNAHVRKSRGRDIDAACGQLRRKEAAL